MCNIKTNKYLAIRRLQEIYDFAHATQSNDTRYNDFIPRFKNIEKIINSFETTHEKIIARLTDENGIIDEDTIRQNFDGSGYTIRQIYFELTKKRLDTKNSSSNESNFTDAKLSLINLSVFDENY